MSRFTRVLFSMLLIVFALACNAVTQPFRDAKEAVGTVQSIASAQPFETLQAFATALPLETLQSVVTSMPVETLEEKLSQAQVEQGSIAQRMMG